MKASPRPFIHFPTISSVRPEVSGEAGMGYTSAVSMKVHALIGGAAHDGGARRLVRLRAEGHRAQADLRHLQAGTAQPLELHGESPSRPP
jgi:hypothetical protein